MKVTIKHIWKKFYASSPAFSFYDLKETQEMSLSTIQTYRGFRLKLVL